MAEDKGYWFTTETGVHIHVEPGETKEQALHRKFGSKGTSKAPKSTTSRKVYEPHGGWDEETDYYTKTKEYDPWAGREKMKDKHSVTLVKYGQDVGEKSVMMEKYGRTTQQFNKDVSKGIENAKIDAFEYNLENRVMNLYQGNLSSKTVTKADAGKLKNHYEYGRNITSGIASSSYFDFDYKKKKK